MLLFLIQQVRIIFLMTEKERIDAFLTAFKELENYLLSVAKINETNHVSFSKALNEVYYKRKDPAIDRKSVV